MYIYIYIYVCVVCVYICTFYTSMMFEYLRYLPVFATINDQLRFLPLSLIEPLAPAVAAHVATHGIRYSEQWRSTVDESSFIEFKHQKIQIVGIYSMNKGST